MVGYEKKFVSLQYKILLSSMFLVIIPLIITGVISYKKSSDILINKITLSNLNTVRQIGSNIEYILNDVNEVSLFIIQNKEIKEFLKLSQNVDEGVVYSFQRKIYEILMYFTSSKNYLDSFYIKGYNGLTFDINLKNGRQCIDTESEKEAKQLDGGYLWEYNNLSINPDLPINVFSQIRLINDIYNISEKLGILQINIQEEKIAEIYKEDIIGKKGVFYIIDNNNKIVSAADKTLITQSIDFKFIKNIFPEKKSDYYKVNMNNQVMLVTYYYLQPMGGYLLNIIPIDDIVKENNVIKKIVFTVTILVAANELPDMFDLKGSWVKNFVENGRILALNDILDAAPQWKAIIKQEANARFVEDGKLYGLGLAGGGATSIIFYNEDIFKECGINEFPKTYTEFKDAIIKIKGKGYTPISMGNKGKWLAESCYLSTIGSRFTGEDWNQSIVHHKGAKFTDTEFIKALKVMQELAKMGAFNSDMNSTEYAQQRTPYYNKKAAMFVEGDWAINHLIKNAPEDVRKATHLAMFPDVEDGKGETNLVSGGKAAWASSLNSKLEGAKLDAAVKFLKLFISKDTAKKLYEDGRIPAIACDNYDKSKLHRLNIDFFEYRTKLTKPCAIYDGEFDASVIEVMNSGLQELLIGTVTSEELAQRIQKEYETAE